MPTAQPSSDAAQSSHSMTGTNQFELLLFRLGVPQSRSSAGESSDTAELFGINVFKVREIVTMQPITKIANAGPHMLGVINLRGQVMPVIDLPSLCDCTPKTGLNIILVTEFARETQAFAVESVEEIVRLDWSQVRSNDAGISGDVVTSIARLDGDKDATRLAQVLDVEALVDKVRPRAETSISADLTGPEIVLPAGSVVLAADDSGVARTLIANALDHLKVPFVMVKTGQEAWDHLLALAASAEAEGKTVHDKIALVLTDLEMPELDGFTLTKNIKQDPRFRNIPVVIHSSLSGSTNEDHVRNVGADGYVAKFAPDELAQALRYALSHPVHSALAKAA